MMRNKEVLNEIRKQSRTLIEEKRDKFVKQSLLSDEFIDMMQRNRKPFDLLMSYYQCAIMEIETKFKVLNEEYSLEYDKNPIEGIKSRIKSYDSLLKKIRRKDIPMTLESIEKNITISPVCGSSVPSRPIFMKWQTAFCDRMILRC